jgi:Kelch motif protein
LYYRNGSAFATLRDGHVLMIGGQAGGAALDDVQIYDPATDAWTTDAPLLEVRYLHHAVTLRSGKVLVVGGFKGSGLQSSAELYSR